MEQPCLRMQAGRRDVIRDTNVRTQAGQPIEGLALRRARVRGGEHPEAPSVGAVAPQRLKKGVDPAVADEGHQYVDAVGGPYLCGHLMADAWFARSVCQERGVKEWNEWRIDRPRRPIGPQRGDRPKHVTRFHKDFIRKVRTADQLVEPDQQGVGYGNPPFDPLWLLYPGKRALDLCGKVKGDPVRDLGAVESVPGQQSFVHGDESVVQPGGDEQLIQTGVQLTIASPHGQVAHDRASPVSLVGQGANAARPPLWQVAPPRVTSEEPSRVQVCTSSEIAKRLHPTFVKECPVLTHQVEIGGHHSVGNDADLPV